MAKPNKAPAAESAGKAAEGAYTPVGDVVELASKKRGNVTTVVLQDDVRVWKEERKAS